MNGTCMGTSKENIDEAIERIDQLSPKRRGPQSDRTPWQYTDPSQSPSY